MVRKVDELGRIVLPMEIRRMLDIGKRDALEIFFDDDKIILKKYEPACMFCHSADDVVNFEGRNICKDCADKIIKLSNKQTNKELILCRAIPVFLKKQLLQK